MEFLDVQLDEMEVIEQQKPKYDFPAVSFRKYGSCFVAYLNKHTAKALNNCKYVKIYATAEYIVICPVQKRDYRCFQVNYMRSNSARISCKGLERFNIDGKTYKVYSTPKGLALKINEPFKNRK